MNWYDEEYRIIQLQNEAHRQHWTEAAPAHNGFERRGALRLSQLYSALGVRFVRFGYWLQARTSSPPQARVQPTLPAQAANNGQSC